MKLTISIVGETITDVENALRDFMRQVDGKYLDSNCYCGSIGDGSNTKYDYSISNGTDVFNNDGNEITVYPYE